MAEFIAEVHVANDEVDALGRVATLVAQGVPSVEIFSAVSDEVGRLFGSDISAIVRFERDGTAAVMGVHGGPHAPGARVEVEPGYVVASVRRAARAARFDTDDPEAAGMPEVVRTLGIRSGLASPIVVDGKLWGAITLASLGRSLPPGTERQLAGFTELVAAALANAQARDALSRLADEQAGLRRVATLVAQGASPDDLFSAVAEEVAAVIDIPVVGVHRYEADGTFTMLGIAGETSFTPGSRWPVEPEGLAGQILATSRPTRKDDYSTMPGPLGDALRADQMVTTIGAPIVVDGSIWGFMVAGGRPGKAIPAGTEERLDRFIELVTTAIAKHKEQEHRARLTEEQAALRRVATLVARGVSPDELFAAVSNEVAALFGAEIAAIGRFEPTEPPVITAVGVSEGPHYFLIGLRSPLMDWLASTTVYQTGRTARREITAEQVTGPGPLSHAVRAMGFFSTVSAPIVVEGELWGAVTASSSQESLPADTERRIESFSELVATAIANAQSRGELATSEARARALAEEQAALRRIATLVAEDAPPSELFGSVTHEVGTLLDADFSGMARFDDGAVVPVATWAAQGEHPPVPDRWPMQPGDPVTTIAETQRAVRWDDWTEVSGPVAAFIRDELGVRSTAGTPIVLEGRPWGALAVHSKHPLPQDSESRIKQFSDLVATAIGNAEARAEVARLANEQAALRRVATLVASEASPADVFAKVAEETANVLGIGDCTLLRDEGDGTATVVGASAGAISGPFPLGARVPVEGDGVVASVLRQGRPYRIDHYCAAGGILADGARKRGIDAAVGCPILVRSGIWGALVVATPRDPWPPDTERRLAQLADLVATAVGNAEARAEIERLADEQAALRRVATLVAHGARPAEVFAAVSQEVGQLFGSDTAAVFRFDSNHSAVVVVGASRDLEPTIPVGTRLGIDEPLATARVYRTGRSARFDAWDRASLSSTLLDAVRRLGVVSTVASPIIVEGRRWGAVTAASKGEPLSLDAGERLERFSELVATAIANTDSRAELAASRKRIVAAWDEARRRIERDLHDGTQQRLVWLGLATRAAEASVPPDQSGLRSELSQIASGLGSAAAELQEISRGIHPAILAQGGLANALRTLARRSTIPVKLQVTTGARLPEPIEVAAYYVASEALANTAKHAQASRIDISLERRDAGLLLEIRDDGVGGADLNGGSGLLGLSDRVEALGGSIRIQSQPGNGTSITVELPLEPDAWRESSEST